MKIINFIKRVVAEDRTLSLSLLFVMAVTAIIIPFVIQSSIEDSYDEIQRKTVRIFDGKSMIGSTDGYRIVEYKKADIPNDIDKESVCYKQKYGDIKEYYRSTSKWDIYVLQRDGEGKFNMYQICPYAVGNDYGGGDISYYFERLYSDVIDDGAYNIDNNNAYKIYAFNDINTHYHKIKPYPDDKDEIRWYDFGGAKLYLNQKLVKTYKIERRGFKIILTYTLSFVIAFAIEIFLFILLGLKNRNVMHKASTRIEHLADTALELDYDELLDCIKPDNFMNPYDANKVKVANDLYSALLHAKNNNTVIQIIYSTARKELGIKSLTK